MASAADRGRPSRAEKWPLMTLVKILGVGLGVLLLLLIGGVGYLTLYFDANEYKAELEGLVEDYTGWELHLGGDLDIELVFPPGLEIAVGGMELRAAAGFGPAPVAAVGSAAVRVNLVPLLWGRVEMTRLTGDAVRLHLIRNRDGKTNWAGLRRAQSAGADSPSGVPVSGWHLEYFSINDLQLTYDDLATGTRLKTAEFDVSSDTLHGRRPLQFRAEVVRERRHGVTRGSLVFSGEMTAGRNTRHVTLQNSALRFALAGPHLPPAGLRGALRFAAHVNLVTQRAAITAVTAHIAGLRMEGEFTAERVLGAPRVRGTLVTREHNLQNLLAAFGTAQRKPRIDGSVVFAAEVASDFDARRHMLHDARLQFTLRGADLPPAGIRGVARFALEVDMRKRLAAVKDVRLTALGVTLTGACTVERLADDPRYRGELTVEEFSPRELLAALGVSPPDTRDRSVLATAALHLPFRGDTAQLAIRPVTGRFDETRLTGQVRVPRLTEPAIRFDLRLDALNVDRYRSPSRDPAARRDPSASVLGLPREKLPDLDLVGDIRVGTLTINNRRTTDVVIKVNWDP